MTTELVVRRAMKDITRDFMLRGKEADPKWRCIAGVQVEKGRIAVVWLGIDEGCITLYHSWVFDRDEPLPFVANAIKAVGPAIPLVCEESSKDLVLKLRERGCKVVTRRGYVDGLKGDVLEYCYKETDELRDTNSRVIRDQLNAGLIRVWDTNEEWLKEDDHYREKEQIAPVEGYPLQAATRHAYHFRRFARPPNAKSQKRLAYDNRGGVAHSDDVRRRRY